MSDDQLEIGLNVRRAVLGDAHVDRALAKTTDFTRDFQEYITENVWGDIWSRPGLDRKTRSMLTIGLMAALGRHEEFQLHIRATANTGVTRAEVSEILLQVGAYAGVPAANSAYKLAADVYAAMDKENA
jgi:4-carboxymuconolactone decarboxylase